MPAEQLDPRFGISRRRCGVKVRVEGDAGQIITPGLQEVDEIVTGVIGQPTGARDSLAPLVLCRVETDVLILVRRVRSTGRERYASAAIPVDRVAIDGANIIVVT